MHRRQANRSVPVRLCTIKKISFAYFRTMSNRLCIHGVVSEWNLNFLSTFGSWVGCVFEWIKKPTAMVGCSENQKYWIYLCPNKNKNSNKNRKVNTHRSFCLEHHVRKNNVVTALTISWKVLKHFYRTIEFNQHKN